MKTSSLSFPAFTLHTRRKLTRTLRRRHKRRLLKRRKRPLRTNG